jgi:fluoride exporter
MPPLTALVADDAYPIPDPGQVGVRPSGAAGLGSVHHHPSNQERTLIYSILTIFIGAGLGALLRWGLSLGLNAVFPMVPLGTLAANMIGAYLVGVAVVFFTARAGLPPEWRLFVITGFMGGLTTFSTFSAEVVTLLAQGQFGWALVESALHLLGSFVLTGLGMWTARVCLVSA